MNLHSGNAASANVLVNAAVPDVVVTVDNIFICTVADYDTSPVRFVFSEAVTGFGLEDINVGNGTLSNLATSDNITWTALLTPTPAVSDDSNVVTVDRTGFTSVASGNAGVGVASSNNYTVDLVPPTGVVELDHTSIGIGGSAQLKVTFAEPIVFADLNQALQAENGSLANFSSTDGGVTWYATFTPTSGVSDASNKVMLKLTEVLDFNSNFGTGMAYSANYSVDTIAPSAAITLASSALLAGQHTTATITFNEAVTGFDNSDLSVDNGTLSNVVSSDGGVTWTATYTPDADVADASNAIALTVSSYADAAGNAGAAAASANYTVQTVRPTATVVVADGALKSGEATTVTVTFSEAVSGFDNADIAAANGTLDSFVSGDGGVTWTATLTPTANIADTSNLVTLNNTGYSNAAGNTGLGHTDSNNYALDTQAPSVAVTLADNSLSTGQTSLVTFAFSEAVTGFDNADLSVAGGTLSAVATSDGGVTWTATFTATRAVDSESVVVTVNKAGILDLAGNAGAGSTPNSTTPLPDDTPPATITTIDGVPVQTQTVRDPVTGLDNVVVTVQPVAAVSDGPNSVHPGLADLPLTVGSGAGAVELMVSLPVGAGIQSSGASVLLNETQALQDLMHRIQASGAADATMSSAGQAFLDALADGTLVAVKTLVLTLAPGAAPGQPIIISGGAAGGNAVGLVIDASHLPPGTVIELDNVDFAAVTGPVTLRGGLGQNVVVADGGAQNILLGPDDDVLYGGGGDDIVGSAGGNDRIDGGAGNDIVFGGVGNDTLAGGSGNDVLQGGRSDAGKWDFFVNAQGQLVAQHQTLLADAKAGETLSAADLDHSAAALAFTGADAAMLKGIATLYATAFGRTADLDGVNFWLSHGATLQQAAQAFAAAPEFAQGAGALDNSGLVHALYQNAYGSAGANAAAAEQTAWIAKLDAAANPAAARAELLLSLSQNDATAAHWSGANGIAITGATLATEQGWIAGSGNDVLDGGAGNDRLVGGDGVDTVVYAGKLADYHIVLGADGAVTLNEAKAGGDIDTVLQIEKGQFSDGTVDLGFTNSGAASLQQIGMLYQAVLDRPADLAGMVFWDAHKPAAAALAQQFLGSAEFQSRYGALDNTAFVKLMETNVLNHAPDAAGVQAWTAYLDTHSRAEMVVALVGSADALAAQYSGGGLVLV